MKFFCAIFLASVCAAVAGQPDTLLNVSYDVSREFYSAFNEVYTAQRATRKQPPVAIDQSHDGSSKQARAVMDGLQADVVTMNQETDIGALVEAGLVAKDWKTRLPDGASPYVSTIVFLVRKGNPKGIKDWDDLVKLGTSVIIPNPQTSGNGRYSYLAAWAYAQSKSPGDSGSSKGFLKALFKNVPVLETGGRTATNTFVQKGIGDVLLTFESEVQQIRTAFAQGGFDVVYPSQSILAEFPVSIVDAVVDKRGSRELAADYLEFLWSEPAQRLAAARSLRPRNQSILEESRERFPAIKLAGVSDKFGGWAAAQKSHFAKGGTFDRIFTPDAVPSAR